MINSLFIATVFLEPPDADDAHIEHSHCNGRQAAMKKCGYAVPAAGSAPQKGGRPAGYTAPASPLRRVDE
jgi:hypothetical protein